MQKNLTTKPIIIAVTILLCIYGIIDLPRSKADLIQNLQKNVRLGLDLRGGSHLILQVQVQDAVKAEAHQTIERLKEELSKANVDYGGADRNDPPRIQNANTIRTNIKGVAAAETTACRSLDRAAVLGIYEVKDGPFRSQDQAMAKHGGLLPLNTKLVRSAPRGGERGEAWYLVARNPVVIGNQLRNARSGQDDVRKWETSF